MNDYLDDYDDDVDNHLYEEEDDRDYVTHSPEDKTSAEEDSAEEDELMDDEDESEE